LYHYATSALPLTSFFIGPTFFTFSITSWATSANFPASDEDIQEKNSLSSSIPIYSNKFLRRANFRRA